MPRRWCCCPPILVDHLSSICTFVPTALRTRTEASNVGIWERHRRRLGENGQILASFGAVCSVVMTLLVPQLVHHLGFWVLLVSGVAFIVPKSVSDSDGAFAWLGLAIAVIETWLCLMEFGDDFYYRVGLTHFSTAATVLIFFSGLGAQGAVLYTGALCVMLCSCAPTGILALGICVACLAQVMLCLVVEVLLLQQLLEAQKCEAGTAMEARRAKFMATVCHELKSPLQGIVGLASSVIQSQEGSVSSTQNRHLTLILSCARRLVDMVTNMMDASVLVQDKQMRLSKDAVQLDKLVGDVVTLCGHSRDRSGNSLVREQVSLINAVGPLPVIEADAHRCTQLIYNLVTNALKFTQVGSVEVSGSADEESRTVSLTVADTGIGIAQESLGRIFQPFSQEDEAAQRRRSDGLGLGLSICQDVVTRHGGSLTVESTKGLGSRFRILLPYKMTASVAGGSECASATTPAADPASKEPRPAELGSLLQREQTAVNGSPSADLTRSRSTDTSHMLPAGGDLRDSGVDEASPVRGVAVSPSTAEPQHRRAQHTSRGSDEVRSVLEWCQRHKGASTGSDTSHGVTEPSGSKCTLPEHSEATQRDRPHSSSTRLEPPLTTSPSVRQRSPARAALGSVTDSAARLHAPPGASATNCLFPRPERGSAKVDLEVAPAPVDPYPRSPYTPEAIAAGCDNAGGLPCNFQGHNAGLLYQTYKIGSWESASPRGITGAPSWPLPPLGGAPLSGAAGRGGGRTDPPHADFLPTRGIVITDMQVGSDHDTYHKRYHHDAGRSKDPFWTVPPDGVASKSPLSATAAIDIQHLSEMFGPSRRDSFHRQAASGHVSTTATQSAHDLWELQRKAAHEQLRLRHRMRDEATWSASGGQ